MKAMICMRCINCGKMIRPGNTNGLPNGLGFQLANGNLYNVCSECISYHYNEAIAVIQRLEKESEGNDDQSNEQT